MHSYKLFHESPWHTDLLLPRLTDDATLADVQVLLGGLSLVLSRTLPAATPQTQNAFPATRRLAARLTLAIETDDAKQALAPSEELWAAQDECGQKLDPSTLSVLRKLLAQTIRDELAYTSYTASMRSLKNDFKDSGFDAVEKPAALPPISSIPTITTRPNDLGNGPLGASVS